jgi:hypothetical protein
VIVDIPTANDFEEAGSKFLNTAWGMIMQHDKLFSEAEGFFAFDDTDEEVVAYWEAARGDVVMALAIIQNGVDHLLKARIAEVSPFLLVASSPRDWPRKCDKQDTPFADFRTIDSQDLLRAHDAVSNARLPVEFHATHGELRRIRNAVTHSVDRRLAPVASQAVGAVLYATHTLIGKGAWLKMRRKGIKSLPEFALHSDGVSSVLNREVHHAVELLSPAQVREYLGIEKKKRLYSCPKCLDDYYEAEHDAGSFSPGVAQLDASEATVLNCIVCGTTTKVLRKRCDINRCRGDVIDAKTRRCLTCNEQHRTLPRA